MWPIEATALVASSSSAFLNAGIGPGLGDDDRAVARADLGLVGLDDGVERGRVDIALLGQHGFQRADAKLRLRQLRAVLVIVVHGRGRVRPWGPPACDLRYNIAMPETSRTICWLGRPHRPPECGDRAHRGLGLPAGGAGAIHRCGDALCVRARLDLADRNDHLRPRHACSCWPRPGRLREGGHVRVDVFYADAGPRRRALIDLCGALSAAAAVHAGAVVVRAALCRALLGDPGNLARNQRPAGGVSAQDADSRCSRC